VKPPKADLDGYTFKHRPSIHVSVGASFSRKAAEDDEPFEPKPFLGFQVPEEKS